MSLDPYTAAAVLPPLRRQSRSRAYLCAIGWWRTGKYRLCITIDLARGNYGSGQRKDKGERERDGEGEGNATGWTAAAAAEDEGKSEIAAAVASQHPICGSSFLFSPLSLSRSALYSSLPRRLQRRPSRQALRIRPAKEELGNHVDCMPNCDSASSLPLMLVALSLSGLTIVSPLLFSIYN